MAAAALKDVPPAGAGSGSWLDDGAASKLDRLPRLNDALLDVARLLTDGLNAVMASTADVTFHAMEASRVDRLLERRGGKPYFTLASAPGWGASVALQFDQLFVAVAVHALFGGDDDEFEFPERVSLTPLEGRIAALMTEQIVEALAKGFAATLPTSFVLEPQKPKPDTVPLGKGPTPMLVATFVLHAVGQPVEFDVIIPEAALMPFADQLVVMPEQETNVDPRWSEKLEAEISRASLGLVAGMRLPPMTLGEIAAFAPGQLLRFDPGAAAEVKLSCKGTELFRCDLGQSEGCYSLKLTAVLAPLDPSSHKDR